MMPWMRASPVSMDSPLLAWMPQQVYEAIAGNNLTI